MDFQGHISRDLCIVRNNVSFSCFSSETVNTHTILDFIKEIGFYSRI